MIAKITENILKFSFDSNFYYYKDLNLLIDCGCRTDKKIIENRFKTIDSLSSVKYVILTHLHYDHLGNFDLFKNAKFFASDSAIEDYKNFPLDTIFNEEILEDLKSKSIKFNPLDDLPEEIRKKFNFIKVPGHTNGSICLLDKAEKILFSGDSLFYNQVLGRTDLPTSKPTLYKNSLKKVLALDYKILCPGHDY